MQNHVSISREIFVPREIVYSLWTTPEHLAEWYVPNGASRRDFEIDLVAGGEFCYSWQDSQTPCKESGVFRSIQKPNRIAAIVNVTPGEQKSERELDITLDDLGGKTLIQINETGFTSPEACADAQSVWSRRLDALEKYLSVI